MIATSGSTPPRHRNTQPDVDNEIWRAINPGLSAFRGLLYAISFSVLIWAALAAIIWALI